MMRVLFYLLILTGFIPAVSYAQGINMEAETYEEEEYTGSLLAKEQEQYYEDSAGETEAFFPEGRIEHYTGIGSAETIMDDQVQELDSRVETIGGDMSLNGEKTSDDYLKEHEAALKAKGDMVERHRIEMEKKGDSLQLREVQFMELYKLNQEARRLDGLSEKTYKKERLLIEKLEEEEWQRDNDAHIYRYGAPLAIIDKHQRSYDRVKREIKALRAKQLKEKKSAYSSFDMNSKHILQLGRMDRDLIKARKNLDKAKVDRMRKKNAENLE